MAGVLSGLPSTVLTLRRGDDLLFSTRAAGTLLGRPTVSRGALAHAAISLGWGCVLALVLPRRRPVVEGLAAGLGIAALDLGVIGRRYPAVAALDPVPQLLDHLAYGAVVGGVLRARRRN